MTPDCTMHEKTARLPRVMLTQTAERRPYVIRTKSTGRNDSTKPPWLQIQDTLIVTDGTRQGF
jgi:hypothetical protein